MELLVFVALIACILGAVSRLRYYRGRPGDDATEVDDTAEVDAAREPVHAGQRDWF